MLTWTLYLDMLFIFVIIIITNDFLTFINNTIYIRNKFQKQIQVYPSRGHHGGEARLGQCLGQRWGAADAFAFADRPTAASTAATTGTAAAAPVAKAKRLIQWVQCERASCKKCAVQRGHPPLPREMALRAKLMGREQAIMHRG